METTEINDKIIEILATAEEQIANLYNGQSNFILDHAEAQLHFLIEYLQEQRKYEE